MRSPLLITFLAAAAVAASTAAAGAAGLDLAIARSQQTGLPMFVMGSSDT